MSALMRLMVWGSRVWVEGLGCGGEGPRFSRCWTRFRGERPWSGVKVGEVEFGGLGGLCGDESLVRQFGVGE